MNIWNSPSRRPVGLQSQSHKAETDKSLGIKGTKGEEVTRWMWMR